MKLGTIMSLSASAAIMSTVIYGCASGEVSSNTGNAGGEDTGGRAATNVGPVPNPALVGNSFEGRTGAAGTLTGSFWAGEAPSTQGTIGQTTKAYEPSHAQVGGTTQNAGANTAQPSGTPAPSPESIQKRLAVETALNQLHHINQKEIQLGTLAQSKAQSQAVKSSAQEIQSDHQKMDAKVEQLASQQKVKLEKFSPSTYDKAQMEALQGYSGPAFDTAFIQVMRSGHQQALNELKLSSNQVKDPVVKSLLNNATSVIQTHHQIIQTSMREQPLETQRGGQQGESNSK